MPSPFLLSLDGESKTVGAKTCLTTDLASTGGLSFGYFYLAMQRKVPRLSGRDRTKR